MVYDFDLDDTVPVVQQIIETGDRRLRLVKNGLAGGVVGAIRSGFQMVERGPVLVLMADLPDDLRDVDRMLAFYRDGYDVVAGSWYICGGQVLGGPWLKKSLSRLAGVSLYYLRGMPTHDVSNAFEAVRCGYAPIHQHRKPNGVRAEPRNYGQGRFCKGAPSQRYRRYGSTVRPEPPAFASGGGYPLTRTGTATPSGRNLDNLEHLRREFSATCVILAKTLCLTLICWRAHWVP